MTTSDSTEDLPTNRGRWGLDDELGTLNHISIANPDLTALAATCRALDHRSFLFVVAAAAITGAPGLPVNPLAVF
jgi:hypothetical protein